MAVAKTSVAAFNRLNILRDKRNNRGRLAAAMRRASREGTFPDLGFGDYFKLADAVCDAAADASDSDLTSFLADCCAGGNGNGFTIFEAKVGAAVSASGMEGPFIDLISQLLPVILPLILTCFA